MSEEIPKYLYLLTYRIGQKSLREGRELKLLYAENEEEARSEGLKIQERERERRNWLTLKSVQRRARGFVIRSRRYPGTYRA